jgi:glycosyltransferase involved in cell wall biosynthesis
MKVAFDVSRMNKLSLNRGIGIHAKNLFRALKEFTDADVEWVEEKRGYDDFDLVHIPFFDFFTRSLPLSIGKPFIVTIHDLIPIMHIRHYPPGFKGMINWNYQKLAVKKASRIIAISESSKRDITSKLGFPSSRVDVVYIAPSGNFKKIENKVVLEHTRKKFNLPEKFVLYIGNVNWNKNIVNMTEAVINSGNNLVIVGNAFLDRGNINHPEKKSLKEWIEKFGNDKNITVVGSVEEEDLVCILNLADALVFVSFDEGFGLPIIEAQSCGVPVVTSKTGSMPEVAGGGALLADPQDVVSISSAISKITTDQGMRKQLIREGEENVKRFSWKEIASRTLKVYEKALG